MAEVKKKTFRLQSDVGWLLAMAFGIAIVVGFYCGLYYMERQAEHAGTLNNLTCFTDFKTQDFDGNTVDQSIFSGYKLTVINCWETTCRPCVDEMPDLAELAAEYADQGVQIIGVCGDVDADADFSTDSIYSDATGIIASTGANYRHLIPKGAIEDEFVKNIIAFPTTVFVDEKGNEIFYNMGTKSKEEWKAIIDQKLSEVGSK